jgi:phosphatidylserine decarboxylase
VKLAPEGIPFVTIALVILTALTAWAWMLGGSWWLAVAWTPVAVWVPAFFRDPVRAGPPQGELVIAPADGKVVSIDQVDEPEYLKGRATRVSVFMNVFNVHVNRHPIAGTVEYRDYRPGKFLNATLDKASEFNERMSLGVRGTFGPVLVRQIAGLVARRIVTDHEPGDVVRQGDRLGLIRFGSRVDTFLPLSALVRVQPGDRAVAGRTILAEWPR